MTASTESSATTVAATVAAEDVACGDFVALLNITCEVPSYMWDSCPAALSPEEMVRLRLIPSDAGMPLKVFAVCVPFVYVKTRKGT